jgi:hypothetical protein
MAHRAGLDGRDPGVGDGLYVAQDGGKPVGGDSVGICRNAHEEPYIRASAASKAVDQQAAQRDQHWPLRARLPPSRRHPPADRTPLSHPGDEQMFAITLLANRYPIRPRRPEFIPSTPCRLPACTGGVRKPTGQRAVRSRSSSSHTSRSTTAHRAVSILPRRADQVVRATTNHAPLYMT